MTLAAVRAEPALGQPLSDRARLGALRRTGLLDGRRVETLDCLTRLTTRLLGVPVALVSLVAEDRQVFVSAVGLAEPWASTRTTPLSHSFCQHVVTSGRSLVVPDARADEDLCANLAIPDLGVVGYAGIPLRSPDGEVLGSFCAIDNRPRCWWEPDLEVLRELAAAAEHELDLLAAHGRSLLAEARMRAVLEMEAEGTLNVDDRGLVTAWSPAAEAAFGWTADEAVGAPVSTLLVSAQVS